MQCLVLARNAAPAAAASPPALALPRAATCFFHAGHAASVPCSTCGRFLCALCDLGLEDRHFCPICFEQARDRNAMASLRRADILYDSMALALGWAWVLIYPFWLLAFPAVVYLAIAKWRAPRAYLIPRGRWRYSAAMAGLVLPPWLLYRLLFQTPGPR